MTGSWLQRLAPSSPETKLRLVCCPHAGGMASAFRLWPAGLPAGTEMFGVQYPGRGSRIDEPPVDRIPAMAECVIQALRDLPARRTVVFGHSMGSLVAFEVACQLAAAGQTLPAHLVLSGRGPPHLPAVYPPISHLPDRAFLEQINQRYRAVPAELMAHPDVLALLLPPLRADMAAVEHYLGAPKTVLTCPITAFGGTDDEAAPTNQMAAWRDMTTATFQQRQFPGGHFYLDAHRDPVVAAIASILRESDIERFLG